MHIYTAICWSSKRGSLDAQQVDNTDMNYLIKTDSAILGLKMYLKF